MEENRTEGFSEAKKARIAAVEKLRELCQDKDGPCVECAETHTFEAVNAALEKAAGLAETFKPLGAGELKLRKNVAAAIRTLKEKK